MTGVEVFVGLGAILKQVGTYVGVGALVWKLFGFLKAATDTAKQIPTFMTTMTEGMADLRGHAQTAVSNHLTHIETGIEKMSDSTDRLADNMGQFKDSFDRHVDDNSDFQKTVLDRLPEI